MKTDKIIVLDFDGTLVTHEYPGVGRDIGAFKWLRELQSMGAKFILSTMRGSGSSLNSAVAICKLQGIEFYGVQTNPDQATWTDSPKAYGHVYVDDLALGIPLVTPPNERPYVNWTVVGPMLVEWMSK